jgi:predicted AlkP superfamily phosphohydrolase/phosphomutase
MKQRVIVIGLDGATFDVMDPLLEDDQLPHMADLVNKGTTGRLLSTIPYSTIPAWPSFMTGKNPGKHGVFDFFRFAEGERRLANSQDIHSPTLWELLSQHGKRSIVINVPGTYPPAEIDGIIVSGMLTPAGAQFTSPPEVKVFLDRVTGGYRINSRAHLSGRKLMEDMQGVTEKQKSAFIALLTREHWDFAMMMFRATDVIQHHFWQNHDTVQECYRHLDGCVGEIVKALPDAAIFLISDHGLQGQHRDFHISKWLIDEGYMSIRKGQTTEMSRWEEIGELEGRAELAEIYLHPSDVSRFLLGLGITGHKIRKLVPRRWWNALKRWTPRSVQAHVPASDDVAYEVDWEQTKASAYQMYATENKAIKIMNLDPPSRDRLCDELIEKLSSLGDPQTGARIVRRAYRREELYQGPYVEQAPDIILDLHDGYNITNAFFADDYVTPRDQVRGCHHREGIFVACGDEIESGKMLPSYPSLLDVMPTVLHYLGCPVPDDCDGRVLREIFEPDSIPHGQRAVHEPVESIEPVQEGSAVYTDDEQAEIERRLRALGYL